jgi:hypothetical protein
MTLPELQKILENAASFCDFAYTHGVEEKDFRACTFYETLTYAAEQVEGWMASSEEPR